MAPNIVKMLAPRIRVTIRNPNGSSEKRSRLPHHSGILHPIPASQECRRFHQGHQQFRSRECLPCGVWLVDSCSIGQGRRRVPPLVTLLKLPAPQQEFLPVQDFSSQTGACRSIPIPHCGTDNDTLLLCLLRDTLPG